VAAVVFLYQITVFFTTKHNSHIWNFILMTQCKLCTGAAAAAVAVNKERSPMGPMQYLQTPALVESHGLTPHQYADDTQIYGLCSPSHVDLSSTISGCVNDVADWMQSNRLQLNPGKTELLWCTTSRRQNRLPTATLTVSLLTVSPVSSVRDLGIFVDSDLVMRTHVCQTVSHCFAALRQLCSIHHLVSATVFQSLVTALVPSRLDYGNGTLIGLPSTLSAAFSLCRMLWHD